MTMTGTGHNVGSGVRDRWVRTEEARVSSRSPALVAQLQILTEKGGRRFSLCFLLAIASVCRLDRRGTCHRPVEMPRKHCRCLVRAVS